MSRSNPEPLVSVRSALVLLLAVLVGTAVGILTALLGRPWPSAVLAGGAAAGASLVVFNAIIA